MSDLFPIVSLSGSDDLHARAERYNRRLSLLHDAEAEREEAYDWNHRERFGIGFFAQTKPPVSIAGITEKIESLRTELEREQAEIVLISGSLKP